MAGAPSLLQVEVMVTAGANQAFVNVVLALCDAGDEVVLFAPYYFNHLMALQVRRLLQLCTGVHSTLVPPRASRASTHGQPWHAPLCCGGALCRASGKAVHGYRTLSRTSCCCTATQVALQGSVHVLQRTRAAWHAPMLAPGLSPSPELWSRV